MLALQKKANYAEWANCLQKHLTSHSVSRNLTRELLSTTICSSFTDLSSSQRNSWGLLWCSRFVGISVHWDGFFLCVVRCWNVCWPTSRLSHPAISYKRNNGFASSDLIFLGFTSSSKTDPSAFSLAGFTNTGQVCNFGVFDLASVSCFLLLWFTFTLWPIYFFTSLVFFYFILMSRWYLLLMFFPSSRFLILILLCCSVRFLSMAFLVFSIDISPTRLWCCRTLWSSQAPHADQSLWVRPKLFSHQCRPSGGFLSHRRV